MSRQRLASSAYTVAWISALPIESAAAAEMLDEEHDDPRDLVSNAAQYVFGRVGNHLVVMACLPSGQMGNSLAASVAGQLAAAFPSIKFALMVGIGGGVPTASNDIRLGDVVVGHPHLQHGGVVQYDFGKTGPNGQMSRTGFVNAPPKVLLIAIAKLRTNHLRGRSTLSTHLSLLDRLRSFGRSTAGPDVLFQATYDHEKGDTCKDCKRDMILDRPERETNETVIHYGTIASGNQVMKDGTTRDRISAELGGVLCFEMEAAGLASAFPCAVIRGICDYADSHKNKRWQPYAAATAAAVAKELLSVVQAEEVIQADVAAKTIDSESYHVPFSLKGIPRGKFAERPEQMRRLEQTLTPRIEIQSGGHRQQILVLHGLGGIGKTQIAVEFARSHRASFTSVFWLDGSSEASLKQSMVDCMGRIPNVSDTSSSGASKEIDEVVRGFLEWLSRTENTHWLLIFDNVDRDYQQREVDIDAYDVSNYIPEVDHGSVLITTRLANLEQLGESVHIGKVGVEQAQAIFRKWYNPDFDPSDSDELLRRLDGLPLALAQAATYMNETGTNFKTYTKLYDEQWKRLMENESTTPLRTYKNRSINTTWMVSYNAIQSENKSAANLLLLWAHLDNKTLPYWMFHTRAEEMTEDLPEWLDEAIADKVQFLKLIRLLRSYCLVESLHGGSSHSTHPVVHQWAFHVQNEYQRKELSRLAILVIGHAVPMKDDDEAQSMQRQLLPHAESWMERTEQMTLDTPSETDREMPYVLHRVGILFSDRGKLNKAERMYRRALEVKETVLGPESVSALETVNNLGLLYIRQGKLAEAESMCLRALEGKEKVLGADDLSTTGALNNLGNVYSSQGRVADAEKIYRHVLEAYEKTVGPDYLSSLHTRNNLGVLYKDQGRLAESEEMIQRALDGYEKALGPDHASTINTMNNLGSLYKLQGKLAEAERTYQHTLERKEEVFGPDHLSTIDTRNNLGVLYKSQGRLAEAERMYQDALDRYEKTVGPVSILSYVPALNTAFNFGLLLEELGREEVARLMYTRALRGYELVFGENSDQYRAARRGLERLATS